MSSEAPVRRIHLLSGLLLLAIFLAGGLAGFGLASALPASFARWHHHGPPPLPRQFEELGLSADQEARARAIFERARPELDAVLQESYPRVRAINDRMEAELRAILTPEQRQRLDAMKARRPPGPPGGPDFPGGGPGLFPPPPGPPPPDGPPPRPR
jgi:Spy/CpxP family protein refolding chaperone